MTGQPVWLIPLIALACRAGTAPSGVPEGPPDFRGTIAQIFEDSTYLIDDGSATACGFSVMRINAETTLWWPVGGRAEASDLRLGRRVSLWQRDEGEARCRTVDARAVVIEHVGP